MSKDKKSEKDSIYEKHNKEKIDEEQEKSSIEQLNIKLFGRLPGTISSLFIYGIALIGFIIGMIITMLLMTTTLCGMQIMSDMLGGFQADPQEASETTGQTDITNQLEDQFWTCYDFTLFSSLSILSGLLGGFITAYPFYKIANAVSNGKLIRSLI